MPPKKIVSSVARKEKSKISNNKDGDIAFPNKVVTPKKVSSRITDYFVKTPTKEGVKTEQGSVRCDVTPEPLSQVVNTKKNAPLKSAELNVSPRKKLRSYKKKDGSSKKRKSTPSKTLYDYIKTPPKRKEIASALPTTSCVVRLFDEPKSNSATSLSCTSEPNQLALNKGAAKYQHPQKINGKEDFSDDDFENPACQTRNRSVKRRSSCTKQPTPKKRPKMEDASVAGEHTEPYSNLSDGSSRKNKLPLMKNDVPSCQAIKDATNEPSTSTLAPALLSPSSNSVISFRGVTFTGSSKSTCSQSPQDSKIARKVSKEEITIATRTFKEHAPILDQFSVTQFKSVPDCDSQKFPLHTSFESLFMATSKINYYGPMCVLQDQLSASRYPLVSCMDFLVRVVILGQQPKAARRSDRRVSISKYPLSSRYEFVVALDLLNKILEWHPPTLSSPMFKVYCELLYKEESCAYEGWNKLEDLLSSCDFSDEDVDDIDHMLANAPGVPERHWYALKWFVKVLEMNLRNTLANTSPGDYARTIVARIFWHKGKVGVMNYRTRKLVEILRDAHLGEKHLILREASKLLSYVATVIQHSEPDVTFPFTNPLCQDLIRFVGDTLQGWAQQSAQNMHDALRSLKPTWLCLSICKLWLTRLDSDWGLSESSVTLDVVFSRYLTAAASYQFEDEKIQVASPSQKFQALPPVLQACVREFLIAYQHYFGIRDILAILSQGTKNRKDEAMLGVDPFIPEYEYQNLLKDLKSVKNCKPLSSEDQSTEAIAFLLV